MNQYLINPDITKAETLPARFYQSQPVFEKLKENIFSRCWHWLGQENDLVPEAETTYPMILMEDFLGEPVVLVKDKQAMTRCLSNVCTHRANLVVHNPGPQKELVCMYHGRRFGLDGSFQHMPEFNETKDFPRPCDHLYEFPMVKLAGHLFVGLNPQFQLSEIQTNMQERLGFLSLDQFKLSTKLSKDYLVNCHWALYCDNYLEGFHIPFVHSELNQVLDYGNYTTEVYQYANLQIGYAEGSEEIFDLPDGHMDFGKKIAAYYYWIFPNMMFNFYPWGLSVNIVKPLTINKTKVSFITYIYDQTKFDQGAGDLLDKVEREDEFVVEGVQKGLQSRFYQNGRFSPTREQGVHHFHYLLGKYWDGIEESNQ